MAAPFLHDDVRRDRRCAAASGRSLRIDDWCPEDPDFWERTGRSVARRNLFFSVFCEHIGFSIWSLWSVLCCFRPSRCSASTRPASSC